MKGDTVYFEKNGKYYKQNLTWWEKGGYFVPQTAKQISKEEYERMTATKQEDKGEEYEQFNINQSSEKISRPL